MLCVSEWVRYFPAAVAMTSLTQRRPTTQQQMLADELYAHFERMIASVPELPDGTSWLLPLAEDPECKRVFRLFLNKYYDDRQPRQLILGINPGRFGAGLTNVAFTDPANLLKHCGIDSAFEKREELSAGFVYRVVEAFGGAGQFYGNFFVNSVVPFGLLRVNKNFNYYDEKLVRETVKPLALAHLKGLLGMGMEPRRCICIGEGQNFKFFQSLNEEHGFFEEIIPLPHPRFIMQYRRKRMVEYVAAYLQALR